MHWKCSFIPSVATAAIGLAVIVADAGEKGPVVVSGQPEKADLSRDTARLIVDTKSPDWRVRAEAARKLGWKRAQASSAVPALIRLLGDKTLTESDEVPPASRASEALALIGNPAVAALIDTLADEDSDRRERAAQLLGDVRDNRAVAPLIAALSDANKDVQYSVVDSLGRLGDPRAVTALAKFVLDKTKDNFCRGMALRSLGAIPTPEAVGFLTAILKDEGQVSSLRWYAAIALGTTRARGAAEALLRASGVSDKDLRYGILFGLGRTGDVRAVPVLMAVLKNRDEDALVRRAAAIGLGRSRSPDAVRYLLNAIEDKSEIRSVRQSMMAALAFTGDPVATRRLFKELNGGDLKSAAVYALPYISDRAAIAPLVDALKKQDPKVRRFAAKALRNLGDRRAVEPLKALVNDVDPSVAANARGALERIEGPPWSALDGGGGPGGTRYEDSEATLKILGPFP